MHYTDILESTQRTGMRDNGSTSNLRQRLSQHNSGNTPSTVPHRPWRLKLYIAFETRL
jgi:predicted GIY-YIG superfamily endonuclease